MATIAELMVKIDANNRGLNSAIKQSESRVKAFAKSVKDGLAKAFKIGLAASAVAVAGLTAALVKASASVDKLAKTSQKLGIGTKELQKLQLQANLSGVSTETLNMALQRMVRRVAEASQGTGEAVNALRELGLDAKYLNQIRPDRQFQLIANAMKSVGNQSDKVRLAMKLFDSEGVALVNTLGSDLRGVSREFNALGLGISKSQAAAVESFNDSRTMLGAVFDDISGKVLAELAPAFKSVTNDVLEWIKSMGGANVVAAKVKDGVVASFNFIRDAVGTVSMMIDNVNEAVEAAKPAVFDFFDGIGSLVKRVTADLSKLIEGFAGLFEKINGFRQKATTGILDLLPQFQYDPNAPTTAATMAGKSSQSTQKIQVEILPDQTGMVNAVVKSPQYKNGTVEIVQKEMKNTARSTRR